MQLFQSDETNIQAVTGLKDCTTKMTNYMQKGRNLGRRNSYKRLKQTTKVDSPYKRWANEVNTVKRLKTRECFPGGNQGKTGWACRFCQVCVTQSGQTAGHWLLSRLNLFGLHQQGRPRCTIRDGRLSLDSAFGFMGQQDLSGFAPTSAAGNLPFSFPVSLPTWTSAVTFSDANFFCGFVSSAKPWVIPPDSSEKILICKCHNTGYPRFRFLINAKWREKKKSHDNIIHCGRIAAIINVIT